MQNEHIIIGTNKQVITVTVWIIKELNTCVLNSNNDDNNDERTKRKYKENQKHFNSPMTQSLIHL